MKKIAILILAHKNEKQLFRLIKRLGNDYFDFYVHIDLKSDINPFLVSLSKLPFPVKFVESRVDAQLIDFSLVEATMKTLSSALESGNEYLYFALLTGQDYPIKESKYIYDYLCKEYPMCFIDMYGCDQAFDRGVKWTYKLGRSYFSQKGRRILRKIAGPKFYYSSKGKVVKIFVRVYDSFMSRIKYIPREEIGKTEYTYSFGSHFWILPNTAAEFLLNRYKSDTNINELFKHITAPEESYFHTVLSAFPGLSLPDIYIQFSNMDDDMDNPALRLIKWYENGVHTNGHPSIWLKEDYDYIMSRKALFGRKFDENVDSVILDLLDK